MSIDTIKAELADAERHLKEMRLNLKHAQEWVRNAEALHAEKLAEALRAEIVARGPKSKRKGK